MRDPYRVLGIPPSANQHQIRKAYRRKVRRYHPDVNHEPHALQRFQAVQRAYETLNDPRKRAEHYRYRRAAPSAEAAAQPTVTVTTARPRVGEFWPEDSLGRKARGESLLAGTAQVLLVIVNVILAGALVHQIAAAAQLQQRLTAIEADQGGQGVASGGGNGADAASAEDGEHGVESGSGRRHP